MKKFTAMLILLALLACEKNNLLTPQEVEELITKDIEVPKNLNIVDDIKKDIDSSLK